MALESNICPYSETVLLFTSYLPLKKNNFSKPEDEIGFYTGRTYLVPH